jgi:hypothetical protein
MGATSNDDKKSVPAWQDRPVAGALIALRQCWRKACGKVLFAWRQGMPAGISIRKNR